MFSMRNIPHSGIGLFGDVGAEREARGLRREAREIQGDPVPDDVRDGALLGADRQAVRVVERLEEALERAAVRAGVRLACDRPASCSVSTLPVVMSNGGPFRLLRS